MIVRDDYRKRTFSGGLIVKLYNNILFNIICYNKKPDRDGIITVRLLFWRFTFPLLLHSRNIFYERIALIMYKY